VKIIAYKENGRWLTNIDDDGEIIANSQIPEKRLGCAIRRAINQIQVRYGEPSEPVFEISLDDW